MTVQELYEYAKKNDVLDYEIKAGYSDSGYELDGEYTAEIDYIHYDEKFIRLCQ